MGDTKVIDCRLNPNGLYLKLQDIKNGKEFELYGVKLYVENIEFQIRRFPFGRNQRELCIDGSFTSRHPCNQIKDADLLEVTIEDIEKKFGRKVRIIER